MSDTVRPLAVITGASAGIGYEWAKCCARNNYDLIISANAPEIQNTALELRSPSVNVEAVEADMGTIEGVDKLYDAIKGRHVAALLAYSGYGLGKNFLEEDFEKWKHVIDTNITGTLYLVHKIARDMVAAKAGLILITGSINEQMPGAFHAVYNGTKSFLDSFVFALRQELKDSGITVTCLMPGDADSKFLNEKIPANQSDPVDLAKKGFRDMMKGEDEVIMGWQNVGQAAFASSASADQTSEAPEPPIKQDEKTPSPSQRSVFMCSSTQQPEPYGGNKDKSNLNPQSQKEVGGEKSLSENESLSASEDKSDTPSSRSGGSSGRGEQSEGSFGGSIRRSSGSRGEYDEDRYSQSERDYGSRGGPSSRHRGSDSQGGYDEDRSSQSRSGYSGPDRRAPYSRGRYNEEPYSHPGSEYGDAGRSYRSRGRYDEDRYSQFRSEHGGPGDRRSDRRGRYAEERSDRGSSLGGRYGSSSGGSYSQSGSEYGDDPHFRQKGHYTREYDDQIRRRRYESRDRDYENDDDEDSSSDSWSSNRGSSSSGAQER